MDDNHIGNNAGVIFGFTSGILCLIGLAGIFVSLSTQFKIQRCQEIYWQITEKPNNISNPVKITKNLNQLIYRYTKVFNTHDYIKWIVFGCRLVLLFTLILWSVFIGLIDYKHTPTEAYLLWFGLLFGIVSIMFFFWGIGKLGNIEKLSKLPTPLNLINNEMTEDDLLKTIAMSLSFSPNITDPNYDKWERRLDFSLTIPFNHFFFMIERVTCFRKNGTKYDVRTKVKYWIDISEKQQKKMIEKWGKSSHPNYRNSGHIYLDMIIKNDVEDIDIDRQNKKMIIPKDIKKMELQIKFSVNHNVIHFIIEVIFNDRFNIVQHQLKKIIYWDSLSNSNSTKAFDVEKMEYSNVPNNFY